MSCQSISIQKYCLLPYKGNIIGQKGNQSYKLDLCLNEEYVLELFSFPSPPKRISRPEACGGRHLALAVRDLEKSIAYLQSQKVACERIRQDEYTGKRFTFLEDPDGFPIELYEI